MALAALAFAGGTAEAQVERRQLPVLEGEPPPPVYDAQPPASPLSPPEAYDAEPPADPYQPGSGAAPGYPEQGYAAEPPPAEGGFGGAPGAMPAPATPAVTPAGLPADPWQGLDAGAMQSLLQRVPLPSPSPALAKLIAGALAAGSPRDDRESAVRAAGLKAGGRANELAQFLQVPVASFASESQEEGTASPMALFFLAQDGAEAPELRLAAAERAAALNVIDAGTLASAYREAAPKLGQADQTPSALRAKLFASLDGQASPATRAESIDALLASGKDAGIEVPIAEALAETAAGLARDPQAASFAETGIRVAALAGEGEAAWAWVDTGGEKVQSWELLLGAADPSGARSQAALAAGVEIARRARLPGQMLQRLVTVLDALGEDVPIPLWELASQSPEPQDGYLPETGVLSALKEASDRGQVGPTILLAATALGPKGPAEAHLIALGDALRALKRVGLEAEARQVALEALVRRWPGGRG